MKFTEGLSPELAAEVCCVRFNDAEAVKKIVREPRKVVVEQLSTPKGRLDIQRLAAQGGVLTASLSKAFLMRESADAAVACGGGTFRIGERLCRSTPRMSPCSSGCTGR
jgi:hypothetical protein